jgi:hypothetical protein
MVIGALEGALMMSRLDKDPYALEIARDHLNTWLESLRVEKRVRYKSIRTSQIKAEGLRVAPA